MGRTSSHKNLLQSGGLFVAANLLAGGFNYLYQVMASRDLSTSQFSELNAWYAHLAVFFMLGGLLQYTANFYPARQGQLRVAILISHLFLLLSVWAWLSIDHSLAVEQGAIILMAAMASGWLMGQMQIRQEFAALALVNFVLAGSRLAFLWAPWQKNSALDQYSLALFACYLPAFWVLSVQLWSATDVPIRARSSKHSWLGPIVLSGAGALMPQFDLLIMNHTQTEATFSDFARASLFYKAIYFLLFIVAQLVLPKQLSGQISSGVLSRFPLLAFGALAGSALLASISPFIGQTLLGWSQAPESQIVFLSCLHMSLLTLIFFWIQEQCARHRPGLAAAALALLGAEALGQWLIKLPTITYLYSVIGIQSCFLFVIWQQVRLSPRSAR